MSIKNLKETMELGAECLIGWCNPERNYLPMQWLFTHDLGRWYDAMLRLEDATGYEIPGHIEEAMLCNLNWIVNNNSDGLLFVPAGLDWQNPVFELHSLREGILTFSALVNYRQNKWAAEAGHRYLETIQRCLKSDDTWDVLEFDYAKNFKLEEGKNLNEIFTHSNDLNLCVSHGRSIEAILWFYETTKDPLALILADRLARYHLAHTIKPDGTLAIGITKDELSCDTQSYLYTLCGLLHYGLLTHQSEYVDNVVRTYQVTVPDLVKESGWSAHCLGKEEIIRFRDELGNPLANTETTGAALRLALWLALYTEHVEFYDDVERLVRARIIPTQITRDDINNYNIKQLGKMLGGWGCIRTPHAGKGANPSGTAEILHTLSIVYKNIYKQEKSGLVIYMHFDFSDDKVKITTNRANEASVIVSPHIYDNVLIRVPGWVDKDSIRISVDNCEIDLCIIGSFVYVSKIYFSVGSRIKMCYDLPVRHTVEKMPAGDTYQFRWRGDEIVGVYPNERDIPFYPTLLVTEGNILKESP